MLIQPGAQMRVSKYCYGVGIRRLAAKNLPIHLAMQRCEELLDCPSFGPRMNMRRRQLADTVGLARLGVSAALFPPSVYPPNDEDAPLVKLDELLGLNAEVLPLVEECPEVARGLLQPIGDSPAFPSPAHLALAVTSPQKPLSSGGFR